MADHVQTETDSGEIASDGELIGILRESKAEGIPALTTAQIDEIGGYGYSNQGLNERLEELHEDQLIGHQIASGRHMWSFPDQGTTEEVSLPSLEELVDYEKLDPERFSQGQAEEIAEALLPDYGDENWWQRLGSFGDKAFRIGVVLFILPLAVVMVGDAYAYVPDILADGSLALGIAMVIGSVPYLIISLLGQKAVKGEYLPEEPFGGEDLIIYLLKSIYNCRKNVFG